MALQLLPGQRRSQKSTRLTCSTCRIQNSARIAAIAVAEWRLKAWRCRSSDQVPSTWYLGSHGPTSDERRPCARPYLSSIAHCQFYRDRVDDHVAIANDERRTATTKSETRPHDMRHMPHSRRRSMFAVNTTPRAALSAPPPPPPSCTHSIRIRFANRQLCIGFTMMSSRDRVNLRRLPATTVHYLGVKERERWRRGEA